MESDWVNQNDFYYLIPGGLPPVSILDVYLFYQKEDVLRILSGCIQIRFQHAALVTMGVFPSAENIRAVSAVFRNAKFRTALGDDLPAIVLSCKIALWLSGFDATFFAFPRRVEFVFKADNFSCPESLFTLNRFCRITGFRTNLRHLRVLNNSTR